MRTVIFDLDGTLADTSGDLLAAANSCFASLGLAVLLEPSRDAGTALRGGRAMLRAGLERETGQTADETLVDQQYPNLLRAYREAIDVHTVLYPGAMTAVEALKSNGFAVGVCTNKPEGLADLLLTRLGVRDTFGAMLGADTLPVRKPDPEHFFETVRRCGGDISRSCLIGDTATDHNTARAAGVPSVLVTFGPGQGAGQADVRALEPNALLHNFDDLPEMMDRLIP